MMFKAFLSILAAILCGSVGHIFLSKGMRMSELSGFADFVQVFQNPWVAGGILLEILYFVLWMKVLSLAEVSWAVPMNALEYIVVAILAFLFLGERVPPLRWIGISFILVGLFFMMTSWEEKT